MNPQAEARHRRARAALRAAANDPNCTADRAATAALDFLRFEATQYGWTGFQQFGRGAVLLDLRPEAEHRLSYFPRALLREVYTGRYGDGDDQGPFAPLLHAVDAYDPPGEVVVMVLLNALMRAYQLDYFAHGQGDAPLVPFLHVER